MDEEQHGRELHRLELKAAKKQLTTAPPALDNLDTFVQKLKARKSLKDVKEVRAVSRGAFGRVCSKPLGDLQLVGLHDLRLAERSTGRVLLLRVLSSPVPLSDPLYTTVVLPVAAPDGRCTLLRLHCYPLLPASLGRPSEDDVQAVFPAGTVLAVKEPLLDKDALTDDVGLDVDSPADVEFVAGGDKVLQGVQWQGEGDQAWDLPPIEEHSAQEWMERGDKAVTDRRLRTALRCYSSSISQHPQGPAFTASYLRRAALNISLQRYSSALQDAVAVLAQSPDHLEALERQAEALYSLRYWSAALDAYQRLCDVAPEHAAGLKGVKSCRSRLHETETGDYNMQNLYQRSLHGPEGGVASMTDVADYVGPVQVGPSPSTGGGRGLITTRDVLPGEVLLAVRAVASASASDLPESPRLVVYNLQKGIVDTSTPFVYIQNVLWRLMDQPELAHKVYDLYLGEDDNRTPVSFPLVAPTEAAAEPATLDAQAVFLASFWNASTPHKILPAPAIRGDVIEYQEETAPGALFSESAMINHACAWTVAHTFFGDFQITRASQFIPANTEVFASYVPDLPLAFRQPRLAKFFGVCQCDLCQADSADPGVRERADKVIKIIRETSDDDAAFADIKGADSTSNSQLAAIVKRRNELVRDLEATYAADREMPKVDLFFGWEALRAPLRAVAERKGKEKEYLAWGRNEVKALIALGVDFQADTVMGHATPNVFSGKESFVLDGKLPIRTPPRFRPVEAVRSLVLLASICTRISNLPSSSAESQASWSTASNGWLRAALFVESAYIGGGRALFADRWDQVITFEGLGGALDGLPDTVDALGA